MGIAVDVHKKIGGFHLQVEFHSEAKRIGILGASGCGKSMTLRSIAGIEPGLKGRICVDGRVLFDDIKKVNLKPQQRGVGYLFQNYALFPAMTVAENIGAGLKGSKAQKQARVKEMMERFQLEPLAKRLPGELSGGQQQRVALARILAYEPKVILLDEPYSALDVFLRDRLQQEMADILAEYEGTVIMVSHNRDELYRFSEELVILDEGQTVISGETKALFENPQYKVAARLTGCKNLTGALRVDDHHMDIPAWNVSLTTKRLIPEGINCIGIRAHEFKPVWEAGQDQCIQVKLNSQAQLPFETQYYFKIANQSPEAESVSEEICWFVQQDGLKEVIKKGIPKFLALPEEQLLFLKEA